MARPAMAAIVVFHKPSFVEGIGVDGHLYIVFVGDPQTAVDRGRRRPQSSCSLRPQAPASSCSAKTSGVPALPFPKNPKLTGHASAACSMRARFQAPGVQVVALVPVAGPVTPPSIVVMPLESAS
jgi:hypothetical protein